jgi:DEAD/DEAH box helicase domain-containing protein
MNPFVVAEQLRETALDYLRTTFHLSDHVFEEQLFDFLSNEDGMFRGPYIDVRLPFRKAVQQQKLPLEIQPPFVPHAHQVRAFERLHTAKKHQPQHTLVVTGTGSGKTECFLYPILDHCYRHRGEQGIKAILLYPMNALATDQGRRIASILWRDERLRGNVTAGLYVGGKGDHKQSDEFHLVDDRTTLRNSPPDILLTNYKMLDFLMLRPDDARLWKNNGPHTLQYLVLDELHTYDGAQGSDVACLIRRLKARLAIPERGLCAVGTSATVGSGGTAQSTVHLTTFATKVFGEDFGTDSVITEDRKELDEVLSLDWKATPIPNVPPEELLPEHFASPDEYLRRQKQLWLGNPELSATELGDALNEQQFTRQFLQALGGKLLTIGELAISLARYSPDFGQLSTEQQNALLLSYLSLISQAKARIEDREVPYLTCLSQLWLRELRMLTYRVDSDELTWAEDRGEQAEPQLPLLVCRECGEQYLASIQREAEPKLLADLAQIGLAFLERRTTCRAIQLLEAEEEFPQGTSPTYLCTHCLRLNSTATCVCGSEARPVLLHKDRSDGSKPKFLAHCPECDTDDALMYLSSRAATLTSVLTYNMFSSDHNRDKKLLAFTDSVQDASHAAGFLASRTYRFNLRSALQAVVEAATSPLTLEQLPQAVWSFWAERKGLVEALVTLWPPDLATLPEYEDLLQNPVPTLPVELQKQFLSRLAWEIGSEYGFNARVGRTLEESGCSTLFPADELVRQVARRLHEHIEQRTPVYLWKSLPLDAVEQFVLGLLYRLRTRGGVHHPFLRYFLTRGAERYEHLSKRHEPWMAPFSSQRLPRFLLDAANPHFDSYSGPSSRINWYRDWAHRTLGCDRKDDGMYLLYQRTLQFLREAGVVGTVPVGAQEAYGLLPSQLVASSELQPLRCGVCEHAVNIPGPQSDVWTNAPCQRFRCPGFYAPHQLRATYYARVYRSGQAERIHSFEHTGLLQRREREQLEEQFKDGRTPGSPNLLVCTPTLEMGVDVGDLSAVMACSVPPATANYLQRMGRAGRATGNALCVTVARARPHDLYFFHAPMELMRGQVLPPGCFLEAPEMLQRQLIAFAFDQWARQETALTHLQPKIRFYLGEKGRQEFPGRVCQFYRKNREQLTSQFLDLFELSPEVADSLRAFASSDEIPQRLEGAISAVAQEREELGQLAQRCKQRLQELEQISDAMMTADLKAEKLELDGSERVLRRLVRDLNEKYPLNVLTDAGVLPNYAFPEPGVRLKATVLYRDASGSTTVKPSSQEYLRPSSTALRELAPHNHFYAEGRKIRINELGLRSGQSNLVENWRACASCSRLEQLPSKQIQPDCPGCGCPRWGDQGQVLTLVRMKQVSALCDVLADRSTDDAEEREQKSYETLDLIAVGPDNFTGQAYQIPTLPFGAELLRRLTLREINFGLKGDFSHPLQIAGVEKPERGFTVCLDCGRVQRPDRPSIDHAPYCKQRKGKFKPNQRDLFLYREITSEAIRLLLPAATLEVDEQLASFKAALMLGFRRKFQGNPLHLLIRQQSEPVSDTVRRHFLVVYDAVPGGTGYLAEMARPEGMQEILQLARDALSGCNCRTEPERDGCYRCLFAYQNQYELRHVSRRRALELLGQILDQWDTRQPCLTLSEVSLDDRLESELEALFLERFRKAVEKVGAWAESVHAGARSYHLTLGPRKWQLRPQVPLGSCRPDFLLSADWGLESERQIAVFCDGLEYHVCPGKTTSRLADDLEKRTALIQSGKQWIFNVTWDDVSADKSPALDQLIDWLRGEGAPSGHPAWAGQLKFARELVRQKLQESKWPGSPQLLLAGQYQMVYSKAPHGYSVAHEVSAELLSAREEKPFAHLGCWWEPRVSKAVLAENIKVVLRLFDTEPERGQASFRESWRWFLHQWNRLQFLPHCHVTSTSLIDDHSLLVDHAAEPLPPPYTVAARPVDTTWTELIEQAHSSAQAAAQALRDQAAPLPQLGYEFLDEAGRVVGEAELAWVELRVALLLEHQLEELPALPGWTFFPVTQTEALSEHLKERSAV